MRKDIELIKSFNNYENLAAMLSRTNVKDDHLNEKLKLK